MLNSRFAPVIAIAVLLSLAILGLGFFFGINPLLEEQAEFHRKETYVRQNIEVLAQETALLDQAGEDLANAPSMTELISLHAPSTIDAVTIQERFLAAIKASGVEIVGTDIGAAQRLDGPLIDASILASGTLTGYFQTGPYGTTVGAIGDPATDAATDTGTTASGPATPGTAVDGVYYPLIGAAPAEEAAVTELRAVPVTIQVKGTFAEVAAFVKYLQDPEVRLYSIYDMKLESFQPWDSPFGGVSLPREGDALLTVIGAYYLFDPDYSIIDDGEIVTVPVPALSPLLEPIGADEQVGADK